MPRCYPRATFLKLMRVRVRSILAGSAFILALFMSTSGLAEPTATERLCEKIKAETLQKQPQLPLEVDEITALASYTAEFKDGHCAVHQRYLVDSSYYAAIVARESRKNEVPVTDRMVREFLATKKGSDHLKRALKKNIQNAVSQEMRFPNVIVEVEAEVSGPARSFRFTLDSGS